VPVASWLLLIVAVALSAVVAVYRRSQAPAPAQRADPLTLVPPGARLLVSLDVAALSSEAAAELARLGGHQLLGLRETCGFEPLLAVERAVLAMPSEGVGSGDRGSDFALIAMTQLAAERGLECAEKVIAKRGGKPGRTRLGAFTSVRDLRRPLGEVALRDDGMFVLSGGRYFRDVMDAATGTSAPDEAASLQTRLHRSVRSELGQAQLQLTFLPQASALLPGVVAVGLALDVARDLSLRGLLACVSPDACARARDLLDGARRDLAQQPDLSGLAGVSIAQRGDRLEIAGRLPRAQLGPLLAQLLEP
jgi:hypothetical protein